MWCMQRGRWGCRLLDKKRIRATGGVWVLWQCEMCRMVHVCCTAWCMQATQEHGSCAPRMDVVEQSTTVQAWGGCGEGADRLFVCARAERVRLCMVKCAWMDFSAGVLEHA